MADVYSDFARVYDELMDNAPYGDWCENIAALIQEYGISRPVRGGRDFARTARWGVPKASVKPAEGALAVKQTQGCQTRKPCWHQSAIWCWTWAAAPAR